MPMRTAGWDFTTWLIFQIKFYAIAHNVSVLGQFGGLMKYSMLKTLAAKYRTKVSKIRKRYERNGDIIVPFQTNSGEKEVIRRYKNKYCELCGKHDMNIEIHQIAKMSSLTGKWKWEKVMMKIRRKTLMVCAACHEAIHNGTSPLAIG